MQDQLNISRDTVMGLEFCFKLIPHQSQGQNGVIPFQNNGIGNGQHPNQNFNPEYETEYDEDEVDYPAPEVDYPYQVSKRAIFTQKACSAQEKYGVRFIT